ncbi:MAG: SelT/SelW/SelH family protein [Gemmatimonadetes bacterium]|nr:SelT/SelW/SelH family protein [Gemmatimonadota bacterium]
MAAEIKQRYPEAEVTLVESSGGAFEVTVDGELIFSKLKQRRHAQADEILRLIERRGKSR